MEGGEDDRGNASIKRTAGRLGCWEGQSLGSSFVAANSFPLHLCLPEFALTGLRPLPFPYSSDMNFLIEGSFLLQWQKSIQDNEVTREEA